MRVVVFEPDYNDKHCYVLRKFAKGIPGAVVRPVTEYEPCDIAVIFGGVKNAYNKTWSKAEVLNHHSGRSLIMVESAFIKRGKYYQVAWGGAAGHGDFNTGPDTPPDRWHKLGADVKLHHPKPDGPIVVCGQLPRDTQVQDVDHVGWCRRTVKYYAKRGYPVLFRPHPKIDKHSDYGVPEKYIDNRPLDVVLDEARCFVTWNSTSGIDAAVAGVPVVAMDPGSMAWPIASHDLDNVDYRPKMDNFFACLGYSQWTPEEMAKGVTWKHLTAK